jgi:phosphatidylglycerol lysyltransferase
MKAPLDRLPYASFLPGLTAPSRVSFTPAATIGPDRNLPGSLGYQQIQYLLRYGYNSTSYLALEADKRHFIHPRIDAVTAYARYNRVAIAAGEPICARPLLLQAIDEFSQFSQQQGCRPLFFEVTEPVVPALRQRGFKLLKLGEEPFFELDRFSLKGNKMANVRSSGNTARKRGVTVRQFSPLGPEADRINPQLEAISRQWLQGKGIGELSFTLGSLSLAHPADRCYFIAEQDDRVIAFLTYTPIAARNGMYLDLMRRVEPTPPGTMDLLLTESFRLFKEAGIERVTMGMSPLSNVQNSAIEQSPRLAWSLNQLYERGQKFYHFKPLHDFKQKFQPHYWEAKYLAYQQLGWAELDGILQAVQGQSIGQIVWELLNQPIF